MYRQLLGLAGLAACGLLVGCNAAPVAVDDHAVVPPGATTNIAVLDNDRDPDADPMIVKRAWGSTLGSVTINPDNTIAYSARPGVTGTDVFKYRVKDNRGHARNAQVVVDVRPTGPTFTTTAAVIETVPAEPIVQRETIIIGPTSPPQPMPPATTVERRVLATPETTPAPVRGPFVESVLVVLHTTADDKNREEPVRIVLRRGNEILADRTVGGGELWGSFTDNVFELIPRPQPPVSDISQMVLDIRKVPVGGPAGGGWTMQAEARARLTDNSTAVLMPMTEPVKFGDDAPAERSWTLSAPR